MAWAEYACRDYTILTQIAAETLRVPMTALSVELGGSRFPRRGLGRLGFSDRDSVLPAESSPPQIELIADGETGAVATLAERVIVERLV